MKNRYLRGIAVGGCVFALTLLLFYLGGFQSWEWKTWDWRVRMFSDPSSAAEDIVIFLIDQNSLDVYASSHGLSWPWPREMYAYVVDFCRQAEVKALFFDFIFSEASLYGPEDDKRFADTMTEAGNVFLPVFLTKKGKILDPSTVQSLKRFVLPENAWNKDYAVPMQSVDLPLASFLSSTSGVGNVNFTPDRDGIFRRIPLVFSLGSQILPSLPLAVARRVDTEFSIPWKALDSFGQMVIRYHGPSGTYKSYSIASIINSYAQIQEGKEPQIPSETFRNKIILLGSSAPGLLDLRSTPLNAVCPGVEIQAAVIDNLLYKDFFRRTHLFVLLVFIGLLSLLVALGTSLLHKIWQFILFFLACLALPACAAVLAYISGYWLEFVGPAFAVVLGFMAAALLNYNIEGKQKRFIKSVFQYYLNPHVIERVIKNPDLLKLGGEKREITSVFTDVAGFTSISEDLTPEELVNLLNEYLSEMTEVIFDSGGTLDKYEGDAIIAFWNAPLDQPDHALRACRAALACQDRLERMRATIKETYGHELYMRIGVNSGDAVVGNMGSQTRFDYTAMGDTVNLAARLEGANKQYGTSILIGENTYHLVKDSIAAREVDRIRVVGKTKPVRIYEIFGDTDRIAEELQKRISDHHEALSLFHERQWEDAARLFQNLGDDPVAGVYLTRIAGFRSSPPPENWDGIFDLKVK